MGKQSIKDFKVGDKLFVSEIESGYLKTTEIIVIKVDQGEEEIRAVDGYGNIFDARQDSSDGALYNCRDGEEIIFHTELSIQAREMNVVRLD